MQKAVASEKAADASRAKEASVENRSSSCSKQSKHRRNGRGKEKPRRLKTDAEAADDGAKSAEEAELGAARGAKEARLEAEAKALLAAQADPPQLERSGSQQKPELQLSRG